ncbi:MAG: hypothetical protein RLZZ399_921 [Verrucomicrobiota bacterium]|jgi:hypothetical protein
MTTFIEADQQLRIVRSTMETRTHRHSRTQLKHFYPLTLRNKASMMQIRLAQHDGLCFGDRVAITQAAHLATEVAA